MKPKDKYYVIKGRLSATLEVDYDLVYQIRYSYFQLINLKLADFSLAFKE